MTDTASQTLETRPHRKTSSGVIAIAIVRVLLGLMFLVFGQVGAGVSGHIWFSNQKRWVL